MKKEAFDGPVRHSRRSLFSSRDLSFAKGIKRLTKNRGVDVILNSLAGESLRRSFQCVAPLGRFIEIGKKDFYMRKHLPMSSFLRSVTFASVDLGIIAAKAKPLMGELLQTVMTLVTEKPLQFRPPQPVHTYRCTQLEAAFRFLQSGNNTGKTVIEIHGDDLVPVRGMSILSTNC